MKILMVNTRHFHGGGDSTYTFQLADLLSRHGHTVAFFAMQDPRNIPDPNEDLFISQIDFKDLNQRKSLTSGVKVLYRTIYSKEARRKFSTLLDRFSPDIIHLQNFLNHITPSIIFEASVRRIPMVWTLHDYGLICPNSHFLIDRTGDICEACRAGRYYQAIFKRCKKDSWLASGMAAFSAYCNQWMRITEKINALLAPSRFLAGKLLEYGLDEKRIYHLPLFLDRAKFMEGEHDQGYLLFLGKLEAIKGIDILIEAARKVEHVPVFLVGSASEALASRLPEILPANARYLGFQHGQALAELVRNSLAIVLPSICYENQPFSILEAFGSGKPAIASDLGGMKELVKQHERGLLVKPGDPDALSEAFRWAAAHRDWMHTMGMNARQYAFENHSAEKHYRSLMNIYHQAVPSPVHEGLSKISGASC